MARPRGIRLAEVKSVRYASATSGMKRNRLVNAGVTCVVFVVYWCVRILPIRAVPFCSAVLGRFAFLVLGKHRRRTIEHLQFAGVATEKRVAARLAKENFVHLARTALEAIKLDQFLARFPLHEHVEFDDPCGILQKVFKDPNGTIILCAHIGNWELGPRICAELLVERLNIVYRPQANAYLDGITQRCRSCENSTAYPRDGATRHLLRALRRGEGVALLADQRARYAEGVETELFGRATRSFVAPVKLHLRTGAPMVVGAIVRQPGLFRYKAVLLGPITAPLSGDGETDIQRLAQAYTTAYEQLIREYPAQWLWAHRRWDGVSKKRKRRAAHLEAIEKAAAEGSLRH